MNTHIHRGHVAYNEPKSQCTGVCRFYRKISHNCPSYSEGRSLTYVSCTDSDLRFYHLRFYHQMITHDLSRFDSGLLAWLWSAQQRFSVYVWASIVGSSLLVHASYQLERTLTSISFFYRRYFRNISPMSPHLFGPACGFNRTRRHFIMEGVYVTI